MKTKACSLLIAIIMLFSFVCPAESGYLTISDPYYTDGTNEYDLTGLSANLSYAKAENMFQLLLRAITSYGQTTGGIEIEGEAVSLYADGFSARYMMGLQDLLMLAGQINTDIPASLMSFLSDDTNSEPVKPEATSLSELIRTIYTAVYKDGSQLENAKSGPIDTFLHSGMSAFVVPIEITVEEFDAMATNVCKEIDERGLLTDAVADFIGDGSEIYTADDRSAIAIYEKQTKPLLLNVKGNAYYGENDIFVEWNLCHGDQIVMPVFFEVTNTEKPCLYLNIPLEDEPDSKLVLYATIESSEDGWDDFLEIGILENERTVALITYQVYENAGIPVRDFYLGTADGNALYNFSLVVCTDNQTVRTIQAYVYLDGIEAQLSYAGTISSDYGDKNEQGSIQFATNIGHQARANVGFGTGSGMPAAFIPEDVPARNIVSIGQEETTLLYLDFNNFVNSLMTSLIRGVPGVAKLIGDQDAQG